MYGKLMLNISLTSAYHTSRTLVTTNVPRLPWSLDRFQMPGTVLYTCSCGSTRSCRPATTWPRSFSSRYSADAWYSLCGGGCGLFGLNCSTYLAGYTHLYTSKTAGNWRVLSSDMLVKMNSKREFWCTVRMYSACVVPRSLDSTVLVLMDRMHDRPMAAVEGPKHVLDSLENATPKLDW